MSDDQRLKDWFMHRFLIESGVLLLGVICSLPIRCNCGRDYCLIPKARREAYFYHLVRFAKESKS